VVEADMIVVVVRPEAHELGRVGLLVGIAHPLGHSPEPVGALRRSRYVQFHLVAAGGCSSSAMAAASIDRSGLRMHAWCGPSRHGAGRFNL
jgi:hypothetical protein